MTRDALDRLLAHHFTRTEPRLHYVVAGPADGRPVILLHGFPDFWYSWRHQLPALAAAGLRVYVPDQRGYNLSAKPVEVHEYTIDRLADDVLRLADEVAPGKPAALVAHDFGAAVAWWLSIHRPRRIARQVILNLPHPAVFRRAVRRNPIQTLRSWYVLIFQLPRLPEWAMRVGSYRALTRAMLNSSRPGAFSAEDLVRYRDAWSQPGALAGMLGWYRALRVRSIDFPTDEPIAVPTLILWGVNDVALVPSMAEPSRALCRRAELIRFEHCTHWLHLEEPHLVNRHLLQFLVSEVW